jgi:hypothetical protein
MKDNNFKSKTIEELTYTFALFKMVTGALIFAILILLSVTIYGMMMKDDIGVFVTFFVIGISCSATLPFQFINMRKIKTELKLRKMK